MRTAPNDDDCCPYKPGFKCEATPALAVESKCIGCTKVSQCDYVDCYLRYKARRNDAPVLTVEAVA